jgi:hypothetical protein
MNFERHIDPKESLMIGRKANARKVSGYYLLGKLEYDNGWLSENMGFSTTDKEGTIHILEILAKGGIPSTLELKTLYFQHYQFHSKIKTFSHPITWENYDINKVRLLEFNMQLIGPYSPIVGNVYSHSFNVLRGLDLVFENVLYVIPK